MGLRLSLFPVYSNRQQFQVKPSDCSPDPTRPDPTRPDPTRPDPTRPDPTRPINRALCRTKFTCFGQHMDVNYQASLQTLNVSQELKWNTNTCHTIYINLLGITFGFGRPVFCSFIFLPVHLYSIHPHRVLLVQMTGGQVSAESYAK